jgi:fibronectin-binding autotransporter adhesin
MEQGQVSRTMRGWVVVLAALFGAHDLIPPLTCSAAEITWTLDGDGLWSTPQNWSSNSVPGGNDTVLIDRPGLIQVQISSATVNSLISNERILQTGSLSVAGESHINGEYNLQGNIAGNGDLTIAGSFNWSTGTMQGAGKTILAASSVSNLSATGATTLSRTLDNAGIVNYTPTGTANFLGFSNGVFNNLASGTFNYSDSLTNSSLTIISSQGTSAFNNAGIFNLSPSSNASITRRIAAPVNNSGVMNVYNGMLQLDAGGTNSGTINVSVRGNLNPTAAFTNSGTINFAGGSFNSPPIKALSTSSFTNLATGKFNLTSGILSATGGSNSGELHVSPAASLVITNMNQEAGSKITGEGSVGLSTISTFAGSLNVTGQTTITGNVNFVTDQTFSGPLVLAADLGGPYGTGNLVVSQAFDWTAGTMSGPGKTTLTSSSITTLGSTTAPSATLTLGRTLDNSGTVNYSFPTNANLATTSTGVFNNLVDGTVNISSTVAGNINFLSGSGAFNNAGTLNLKALDSTRILASSTTFTNSGTTNLQLGVLNQAVNNSGVFNLYSGGSLLATLQNTGLVVFKEGTRSFDASKLSNQAAGKVRIEAGAVTFTGSASNSGNIEVFGGASVTIPSSYTQLAGSSITGSGSVSVGNIFNFAGNLASTGDIFIDGTNFITNQTILGDASTTGYFGSGNIVFKKRMDLFGGNIGGTGITTIDTGAVGQITLTQVGTGLAGQLVNKGNLTISGSGTLVTFSLSGGTLNNTVDGTLNIVTSATTTSFSSGPVNNDGTMNVQILSSAAPTFTQGARLTNTGTINLQGGTMTQSGGGTNTGTINVYPGAGLSVNSITFANSGNVNYVSGLSSLVMSTGLTNTGHVNVLGGILTVSGTGANSGGFHIAAGAQLTLNSGITFGSTSTITGPGTLVVSAAQTAFTGSLNSTGLIQINAPFAFQANQNLVGTVMLNANLSGPSDVTLTGPSFWTSGSMSGPGKTIVPNGAVLQISGTGNKTLSRTLNNAGTIRLTGSPAPVLVGGSINNQTGAVVDLQGGAGMTAAITNAGLLKKSGGGISTVIGGVTNSGLIQVESGTLSLTGNASDVGTTTVSSGATLELYASRQFNAMATLNNLGMLQITNNPIDFNAGSTLTGSGNIQLSTATVTFAPTAIVTATGPLTMTSGRIFATTAQLNSLASIAFAGGTLNISGDNTTDKLTWTGGTLAGTGTTTVPAGKTFTLSGSSKVLEDRTLTNAGTIVWTGGNITRFAPLVNQTGAIFDVQGDLTLSGVPMFTNAGTFRKSVGSGTANVDALFNSGTVGVQAGTLKLNAGNGSSHSGTFIVAANSSLIFSGDHTFQQATVNAAAGSTISFISGNSQIGAGTVLGGAGSYQMSANLNIEGDNTFENWMWIKGKLSGTGTTTVPQGHTFTIGSPAGDTHVLDDRVLANFGILNLNSSGGLSAANGARVDNLAGGVIYADDSLLGNGTNVVNNFGLIVKTQPTTTGFGWILNNEGTLEVRAGTLSIPANIPVTQLVGDTLTGGTWNIFNGGRLDLNLFRQIQSIGPAASVRLSGPDAGFSSLTELQNNSGKLQIDNGQLFLISSNFTNAGTLVVGAGSKFDTQYFNRGLTNTGMLQGSGQIATPVLSSGTISPGMSVGTLTFGNQLLLQSGSKLVFEIGGVQRGTLYDHIDVVGSAALAGTLDIRFANGFQSQVLPTDTFELLTAMGGLSGALDTQSGGRVYTSDGIGSFIVSYPTGSDSKSVLLNDFIARGDFNRDGALTPTDLPIMLSALTQLDSYASAQGLTPAELIAIGDLDGSGTITNADIQSLLDRLVSGSASSPFAVPEPSSSTLACLAIAATLFCHRRSRISRSCCSITSQSHARTSSII